MIPMKQHYNRGLALCLALGATVSAAVWADGTPLKGDVEHGKTLYGGCMGCHSLDDNDVGPAHRGVVGRKAASVPDYAYSAQLKASGIVWDPASLDRWLTNPQKMVPGAKMYYSVPDAQSRADIIAYLATQK